MKRLIRCSVAIGVFLTLASVSPVLAVDRQNAPPLAAPKPTRLSAVPLTPDECTGLGGTVKTDNVGVCISGKVCRTRDELNKTHLVCLSKQ